MTPCERAVFPYGARVCEERHGEFEHFLEALARTAFILHPLRHDETFALKLGDALFVTGNDAAAGRIEDTVEQGCNLLFDFIGAPSERRPQLLGPRGLLIPCVAEHGLGQRGHFFRWLDARKQARELAFHLVPANGLAIAPAAPVEAHVVRMLLAGLALGPARGERLVAFGAEHEAAQGEVLIEIGARRKLGLAAEPFLNALKGLQRDQPLMARTAQWYAPFRPLQIARIEHAGEDAVGVFIRHRAKARLGEFREALEEAPHFGLGLETPGRIAFEPFLDDRSQRFIGHQHLALALALFVAVAGRTTEGPIAAEQPCALAVEDLLRVLLALMLGDRGEQVLDQNGIGVFAEFDGRTFQLAARRSDGGAQIQMRLDVPRKAADIIDQDDGPALALALAQITEHGLHAGTVNDAAGHRFVLEHPHNFIALHPCKFPAARFL